jgi:hypothetical protein
VLPETFKVAVPGWSGVSSFPDHNPSRAVTFGAGVGEVVFAIMLFVFSDAAAGGGEDLEVEHPEANTVAIESETKTILFMRQVFAQPSSQSTAKMMLCKIITGS